MSTLYQWTFFLALTVLGILVTIFVFAVALLGRALEVAAQAEKEKLTERKKNNEQEMGKIKKEIDEAKGQIPKGLTKKLLKLEKKDKEFEKDLSKIRRAPELLTVKGGVIPAGIFLIAALTLSGVSWYLSTIGNLLPIVPVLVWVPGLGFVGYSVFRICRTLKVIENVAITSEEAALRRTVEAFKTAQAELEEAKKPKLKLVFSPKKSSFEIEAGKQTSLRFLVYVVQGDIARHAAAYFFAPPDFEFPGHESWRQREDSKDFENFVSTRYDLKDVRKTISNPGVLNIKAPTKTGSYAITCRLVCDEGYAGPDEQFQIRVTLPAQSSPQK